jgi:hypothetical protein
VDELRHEGVSVRSAESNIALTTQTEERRWELRSFHPRLRSTEMEVHSVESNQAAVKDEELTAEGYRRE